MKRKREGKRKGKEEKGKRKGKGEKQLSR